MALLSIVKTIDAEEEIVPRFAAVIAWTRRDGWRVALGVGISAWGIIATRLFLV